MDEVGVDGVVRRAGGRGDTCAAVVGPGTGFHGGRGRISYGRILDAKAGDGIVEDVGIANEMDIRGLNDLLAYLETPEPREGGITRPQVIISCKRNAAPIWDDGTLVLPRTGQVRRLPDANEAAGLKAEVDAIAGTADDARVMRPTLTTTSTRIGLGESASSEESHLEDAGKEFHGDVSGSR